MFIPEHIVAVGAELVLAVTAISIGIELINQPGWRIKLGAIAVMTVAVAALFGAIRYSGADVIQYHQIASRIAGHIGMVGFVVLLAIKINQSRLPNNVYYLLLVISLAGYALQIGVLKDIALIVSMLMVAVALKKQQLPGYHFYTAFIALLAAGALSLTGLQSAGLKESLFHLLLAATLYQYYRQYCYRI
ncbi:hypothetical protein [Neptunicella sp. SCSIO 80796]|uniref:hypothetical protein n=1 Tax=Neptunicella plasticusilytica TaxID=3117012 RepID=UPI003A4E190D